MARYVADGTQPLAGTPHGRSKAVQAARLTLRHLGLEPRGRLEVRCRVRPGVGLGSSTSDVVAAIRAVGNAYDRRLTAAEVAAISVEAELASDPIMFGDEVILFAQRHGYVVESWGQWFPSFTVLSVAADSDLGGVETLSLPVPRYTPAELSLLESLIRTARDGFRTQDSGAVAAVATASAELNQRFLPLKGFGKIHALAKEQGALGVQISHSGSVMGVLFDAHAAPAGGELVRETVARLESHGITFLAQLTTGSR